MLAVDSPVHVRKLKPGGVLDYAWDGVVLRCDATGIVLRAEFNVDLVERDFATFRRGDIFVEFYYWDQSYNVFEIRTPDGTPKGWYANVGLPAELSGRPSEPEPSEPLPIEPQPIEPQPAELQYVDLALDVWAEPNGDFVVLDQDEFDALLVEHPELAEAAERGRAALLALAAERRLPRWDFAARAET